ncbi:hypothetical protein I3842_16G054800 [Carya illinoinensis]|uniref:Uncharacterized protein n=1 Tax=Carya illinoinensis TaxID=32201 RepID=A0A922A780_CARIL|nr:hypothetical protein I3842_16G054800 [Carya illinoinensis]
MEELRRCQTQEVQNVTNETTKGKSEPHKKHARVQGNPFGKPFPIDSPMTSHRQIHNYGVWDPIQAPHPIQIRLGVVADQQCASKSFGRCELAPPDLLGELNGCEECEPQEPKRKCFGESLVTKRVKAKRKQFCYRAFSSPPSARLYTDTSLPLLRLGTILSPPARLGTSDWCCS